MSNKQWIGIVAIVAVSAVLGAMILRTEPRAPAGDAHGHDHASGHADAEHHGGKSGDGHEHGDGHADAEHHAGPPTGPHGGKLLADGDFGLEILLAEEAGEPRFKVWLSDKGKPLAPAAAQVTASLARPDGGTQQLAFAVNQDHLISTTPIGEPHVFEATIAAQTSKEPHLFTLSVDEDKLELTDAQVKASGIAIATVNPARIVSVLKLPGEIRFNEDRTAHVVPRVAGVVEAVHANLGQQVKKGQVLAVLASTSLSESRSELLAAQRRLALAQTTNEREKQLWEAKISAEQDYLQSQQALHEAEIAVHNARAKLEALGASAASRGPLNRYEIRAPFDGMVVEKHIALGEAVKEDTNIFTLSDLSQVWAEIIVPAHELKRVRVGEKAKISATAFESQAHGTVSFVGALIGEQTRTAKARVTLANPDMAWRPGLFVNVEIAAAETDVPAAVSADAIQSINDRPTVFLQVPGGFIPQPVELGASDGKLVQITKGLAPGARYAAQGSFVLKAELGKAGAGHQH